MTIQSQESLFLPHFRSSSVCLPSLQRFSRRLCSRYLRSSTRSWDSARRSESPQLGPQQSYRYSTRTPLFLPHARFRCVAPLRAQTKPARARDLPPQLPPSNLAIMADSRSLSSSDGEKLPVHHNQPQGGQVKDKATEDHLEHYVDQTTARGGFSSTLAAVQEAHGFKAEAGRLVVSRVPDRGFERCWKRLHQVSEADPRTRFAGRPRRCENRVRRRSSQSLEAQQAREQDPVAPACVRMLRSREIQSREADLLRLCCCASQPPTTRMTRRTGRRARRTFS